MGWNIKDPSLGNDPSYLTPRIDVLEKDKIDKSEKGVTVATLGVDKKVPLDQLPEIEKGGVKSVNGDLPDENGNVIVPVFSGSYSDLTNKPVIPTTKGDIGLSNVDNIKQMPIAGGTYTGIAKAHPNTSHTVGQIVNVIFSPDNPPPTGESGTMWVKYE